MACEFDGQKEDCEKSFKVVITDYGFCCSFNAIPNSEGIRSSATKGQKERVFMEEKQGQIENHERIQSLIESTYQRKTKQSTPDICPQTPLETGNFNQVCTDYKGEFG